MAAVDLEALTDLDDQTEVVLGEPPTTFYIEKLPATRSLRAWRETLNAAGKSPMWDTAVDETVAATGAQTFGRLVRVILTLDPDFIERLQAQLFAGVQFQRPEVGDPQPVRGAEDTAFKHLEPVDVEILLARAFAVNFMPSLRRLGTWATGLGLAPAASVGSENGVPSR